MRLAACLIALAALAAHAEPLVIGETFTMRSEILQEERRINVYVPPMSPSTPLPVLYMPDGGVGEDFLHVAGLVQVLTGNGTMRPFILVGIALFDTYLAFDPSLWWNDEKLTADATKRLRGNAKTLFLATSDEPGILAATQRFVGVLRAHARDGVSWSYEPMPDEQHSTIYHPAALRAFRSVFAPKR